MEIYGFKTGDLEIKPYLSKVEIWQDCDAQLIKNLFRRGVGGHYIIPTEEVEPYYRSKNIPEHIIQKKMMKLKLIPQVQQPRPNQLGFNQLQLMGAY
jgi:hypothetical protein